MVKQIIFFILLIGLIFSVKVWPLPKSIQGDETSPIELQKGISQFLFQIKCAGKAEDPEHIQNIIKYYDSVIFGVQSGSHFKINQDQILKRGLKNLTQDKYIVDINIDDCQLKSVYNSQDEKYTLNMKEINSISISTPTYVGFLRAFETFSQHFTQDNKKQYFTYGQVIDDSPDYTHRAMMLDTSRHFLSLETLKKYTDAMMFNKLNVLHIHFTDNPSFPIEIKDLEQLSQQGKFEDDQFYSVSDIQELIQYALTRGVRIIPEINAPTNTYSWGLSDTLKDISILCKEPNSSQLDPSQKLTFSTLQTIMSQINEQFPDNFVHFGGQAADSICYQQSQTVSKFMSDNNMNTLQLQQYFRNQQKNIWSNEIASKKQNIIYWADTTNLNIGFEETDIIQWIGSQTDISKIQEYKNKIIISYGDSLSLDKGFGTVIGQNQENFSTWLMIYQGINFQDLKNMKGEIIGAEALLWGELNDDQTTMVKSWIRGSCLAERTWNQAANDGVQNNIDLVQRLQEQLVRMTTRGIPCSPITTEYCTNNPEICFYNH